MFETFFGTVARRGRSSALTPTKSAGGGKESVFSLHNWEKETERKFFLREKKQT